MRLPFARSSRGAVWLRLDLDPEANAKGAGRISRERSRLACYVIPTDEELMIARNTLRVLHGQAAALLMEKHA
jgi:acetate kinase